MSSKRGSSTSRTSSSIAPESCSQILARDLHRAVEPTAENIPENDKQSHYFLPKADLDQILNAKSLELLFREIIPQADTSNVANEENGPGSTNTDRLTHECIRATKGTTPRMALLALFLYQDRPELLSLFSEWLTTKLDHATAKSDHPIPCDESMPFTRTTLAYYKVPSRWHKFILGDQSIFKPATITKLKHNVIGKNERLPFIGRQEPIKKGSSGDVVKAEIARGHWQIQEDHDILTLNPRNTKVVALKTFKAVGFVRDMFEAGQDFEIEREILAELRECKDKHDSIMLDWGSIEVLSGHGTPPSHSLIFELASFSLGDLLKNQDLAQGYVSQPCLLASLVDIIGALECLHDKLKAVHLDVKPDNILIFANHVGHGKKDQYDLIWKLSDFGLARKKESKQNHRSAQTSKNISLASTLPATRPAGLCQAPEIQEQVTSEASVGSDVWSMGCVALMVLAFMSGGSRGVTELETYLIVHFPNGGREPLFYMRSDSLLWKVRSPQTGYYLSKRAPDVDEITGTGKRLLATLHPGLIDWSNILLLGSYDNRIEQRFVLKILKVIFDGVLRIDRNKRIATSAMRERLAEVQQGWNSYVRTPGKYQYRDISADLCLPESFSVQEYEANSQERLDESFAAQVSRAHRLNVELIPEVVVTDPQATRQEILYIPQRRNSSTELYAPDEGPPAQDHRASEQELIDQMQEKLRSAIEEDDTTKVRLQLGKDPNALCQPCPGKKRCPIHLALLTNADKALDVLLQKATPKDLRKQCNKRTPLDLACERGRSAALECIRKHRDKFDFPAETYQRRKNNLDSEARKIVEDLFKATTRKERGFFGFCTRSNRESPGRSNSGASI